MIGKLVSVQVGPVQRYPGADPEDKGWSSAIVKLPVDGAVFLGAEGLEGDAQYDRKNHGGESRAVNFYPSEHYETWRQTPGLEAMGSGAFGENFSTLGLFEETVCIGDIYRVGEVLLQITSPRGPCYKLNRRWQSQELMDRAIESGRVGWYARALQTGRVQAGMEIELVERRCPEWSIARVWAVKRDPSDSAALAALVDVPLLAEDWRASLRKKL